MPRNGNGQFDLPEAPFVNGTTADADEVNSNFTDIAAGLTQSLSKDGQTVPTAHLPMGGFKHTGASRGTASGNYARYDEYIAGAAGHLHGLTLSNSSGSPNTVIDVAAGKFCDDTFSNVFTLASGSINCATTGANGLDTGSLANNTWYHTFAIAQADGTTGRLASTSVSSPTMPSGYTLKRRIGSFKTNGSAQIIAFVQAGDKFFWADPVQDINATPSTSAVSYTLASVPSGVVVEAMLIVVLVNIDTVVTAGFYVSALETNDQAPATTSFTDFPLMSTSSGAVQAAGNRINVRTNTSQQVRGRMVVGGGAAGGNQAIRMRVLGWIDSRGRDA